MGSSDGNLPRFFKPFMPDHCSQNLRIPDAFQDHITEHIPKRVIIKNSIGKLWPVEVVKIGDGLYFQGGWSKFVKDNSLQIGEFMVFKYNRLHVFEVSILGTNGCEKELIVKEDNKGGGNQVDDGEEMEKDASKYSDKRNSNADKFHRSKNMLSTMQMKHEKG